MDTERDRLLWPGSISVVYANKILIFGNNYMSPSMYGNRSKVFVLLWKKMMQIGQGVLWLYFCPFILEWSTLVSVFVCKNEMKVLRSITGMQMCVWVHACVLLLHFPCQLIMISFWECWISHTNSRNVDAVHLYCGYTVFIAKCFTFIFRYFRRETETYLLLYTCAKWNF